MPVPLAAHASLFLCAIAHAAHAQPNAAALRFFGTGVGPPGQQDRVRIPIDDNTAGPDASTPCDLGAGSFTIDFWVRGTLADNPTPAGPGDAEYFDVRWIEGNIAIDRDIWGASSRDWGVSFAGGRVRFGTGRADFAPQHPEHTAEGSTPVLDGTWRHVAVVREAESGRKLIYVDGVLDYATPAGRSTDDISYPDAGDPSPQTPWGPFIVLAAEKHDAGAEYPSFRGFMDEVRFWSRALAAEEIAAFAPRVMPPTSDGLVGAFRFEEASGTIVASAAAGPQPAGLLIAGAPGNGEWALAVDDPSNVPALACGPGDINADGASDLADFFDFFGCYDTGAPCAELDGVAPVDLADFFLFFAGYDAGC